METKPLDKVKAAAIKGRLFLGVVLGGEMGRGSSTAIGGGKKKGSGGSQV